MAQTSYQTKRQRYEILRAQLENDRSTFMPSWRENADYLLPRRARFTLNEANRGDRRNQKIIDNTGTLALRNLRSGLMSGVTNKARPWFRLTTPDPKLAEVGSVKEWLHELTTNMASVFLRSNFYRTIGSVYADLTGFGTGAMYIERHPDRVIHTQSFPVGSYYIGADRFGRVNVFFRDFRMTVRQLVDTFGKRDEKDDIDWSKFTSHIKKMWEDGHRENWIDVCHVILPNDEFDPNKSVSKFKRYLSCYYERGTDGAGGGYRVNHNEDTYLSEMGYDYFPVLCPRWETTGEDVYGTSCPGIDMIGDVKALQLLHRRLAQAIETANRPPMKGPSSLKTTKASILPGDITYVDEMNGQDTYKPAFQIDPRIQEMLVAIEAHQMRIKRAAYEDLLMFLSADERNDRPTAYEVQKTEEEKYAVFGPVLENMDIDLFDPLIDIVFHEMLAAEMVEPPPEELQGKELKVEYISVMHQSMKLIGVGGMERYIANLSKLAVELQQPSVMDKVDVDQYADVLGDALSVNPSIIRSDDKVGEMRAQREKAAQAQAQAEQAAQAAAAAKDLAGADMSGDSALTRLAQGGQGQLMQ